MQRYLSIVLDNLCAVSKTIVQDESYRLDDYISRNFNDSKEVRKKFNKIIQPFLEDNAKLINYIEKKNNKRYQGQIVILEVLNDGSLKRIKVIYKNDLKVIKNECLKNQSLMKNFIMNNRQFFSRYINDKIKRNLSKTDYEYMINEWYRNIKGNSNYFDICRALLKFKEQYLHNTKLKNVNNNFNDLVTSDDVTFISSIEYDPDLDYYPDLDEIEKNKYHEITTDLNDVNLYLDDTEEIKHEKVKKKSLNLPGQTSFFD